MNKIPTAEEFIAERSYSLGTQMKRDTYYAYHVKELCIEFAKLHVKAALSCANDKSLIRIKDVYSSDFSLVHSTMVRYNSLGVRSVYAEECGVHNISVEKDSILDAYPENLIK